MRSKTRRRLFWRVFFVLGCLALIDGFVIEPRSPVLKTYHVAITNLPQNMDGFRVVQFSDVHRRSIVPDSVIRRAVQMANSTNADAAVLTGDYVGKKPGDIAPCAKMLAGLATRFGTFAVLGNHDHWTNAEAITKAFEAQGITMLDNSSVELTKGLALAGIDDMWTGPADGNAAMKNVSKKDACIMLSHQPNGIKEFQGCKGLLLTGHTHGGQVNLPPIPRNVLPGLLGAKYIKGWYSKGNLLMYVNSGIGMINPPARFLCRPEVTLYILHPSTDGQTRLVEKQGLVGS